jgi:pimeloyl-ACP methyl ester carboxylesterase
MATHETFATRADPVLVTMPDGCRLAARAFGPEGAPPVLLVAGGDGGMLQWRGLVPELCVDAAERELFAAAGCGASLSTGLRVAAFDARGVGWSSHSHGVCDTTGAAAADALALAAALFGTGFHLVGHGLGAAVALQLALAAGRLVRSLTLLAGTPGGDSLVPPSQQVFENRARLADALDETRDLEAAVSVGATRVTRVAGAEPDAGQALRERLGVLVRRDVELAFTEGFVATHAELIGRFADEALIDLLWETRLARHGFGGPTAAEARGAQFVALDLVARLPELATPTLVVAGDHDRVLPPGNSEALAAHIVGARLVTLAVGHAVAVEGAADVAAALRTHVLLHP